MLDSDQLSPEELLRLYTNAPTEAECARYLAILLETYALPVMDEILRGKLKSARNLGLLISPDDFEDLGGDCAESAVKWLQKFKAEAKEIKDFRSYAAVIAYNVWNNFSRRRAPNRERLKNEIRYTLGKFRQFQKWRKDDQIFFGLTKYGEKAAAATAESLIGAVKRKFPVYPRADLTDLLTQIFEQAKAALPFADLIHIVVALWQVKDLPANSFPAETENNFSDLDNHYENFEMHADLVQLWQEIRELPENQRIALLYNLRDAKEREMLFQFFNLQIASLAEIAAAMNLSRAEFAAILPLLPLSDREIAAKINLTEKQVGNLRKVARENLERRIAGKPKRRKNS